MTVATPSYLVESETAAHLHSLQPAQTTLRNADQAVEQVALLNRAPGDELQAMPLESALDTVIEKPRQLGTALDWGKSLSGQTNKTPQLLLAEWSGHVLTIEEYYFTASLDGMYGEGVDGEEEEAEIPISDVGESDRDLLKAGAVFRLCVYYELQENERPRRYTQVIFRRLPAYRSDELQKAAERAAELHRGLRVD